MRHEAIKASSATLGALERAEAMLGRSDWTVEDYRRAGGEWIDAEMAARGKSISPASRAHHVSVYVQTNCPPAKLKAHNAARAAALVGAGL